MALKEYTLRPEYEGRIVGATIATGPEGGTLDLVEALKEGNGAIKTDDGLLQSLLENYFGAKEDGSHSLVFQVTEVVGDERVPVELPGTPGPLYRPNAPEPTATLGAPGEGIAQHGDQSEYSTFTVEDLRQVLVERNVQVGSRATKQELIDALEQNDKERQSNGS